MIPHEGSETTLARFEIEFSRHRGPRCSLFSRAEKGSDEGKLPC